MRTSEEKLFLKWNQFNENVSSAFGDRRKDMEFADVTLACEDGQHVEAHKVILASGSPFFLDILRRIKHPHPLIYMRGIKSESLEAIIEFLYSGEAKVFQEDLDSFLAVAEDFGLKGLSGNKKHDKEKHFTKSPKQKVKIESTVQDLSNYTESSLPEETFADETEAVTNTVTADLLNLDEQIKSMMELGESMSLGKTTRTSRICKLCGKQGFDMNIRNHIESVHITGVSHPCNICGKMSRSRSALWKHTSNHHKR